jgi:ABC-type glycerol-3-phosphate transport system substrate-binding protein
VAVVALTAILIRAGKKVVREAAAGIAGRQLVFSHSWQSEDVKRALRQLADTFEALNSEGEERKIRVLLRDYPADYVEAMLTVAPAETDDKRKRDFLTSDIFVFDSPVLYEVVQKGRLAPLTDLQWTDKIEDETQDAHKQQWAVPLTADMHMLFYNMDILNAIGFDRPPKNWTNFQKYAKSLTDNYGSRYGLTLSLNANDGHPDLYPWFWAAGALMMKDGTFRDDPAENSPILAALQFFARLNQDRLIMPSSYQKTKQQKIREFTENRAAMMVGSIKDIETVRRRMYDSSFGVSTIPVPDNFSGKPIFGLLTTLAGINAQSALKEEAQAFLSFLLEHSSALAAAVHVMPGNGNTPTPIKASSASAKAYDMFESSEIVEELSSMPKARVFAQIFCTETAAMLDQSQTQARMRQEELRAAQADSSTITRTLEAIAAESALKTAVSIQKQWKEALNEQ